MKKKSTAAKPSQLAVILNALDDLKAQNVVAIDVTRLSDVMDTLVIASGSSNRQVRGLAQHAAEEAKKNGMPAMGSEGMDDGEWALVDFGDLVLHVMQPEVRDFYELEKLWLIPGHSEIIDTQTAASKTAARKKPAASSKKETAAKKPGKAAPAKKTSARKKMSDDVMVSQSDASKARRRKTATATTARKKAPVKTAAAPTKAGTYAKTGTRKPAAAKSAPSKTTTAKKPATAKAKPAVAKAKPAAKKAAPSKPRAPRKG